MSIFTNCGTYLPGQRPVTVPPLPPAGGSVIIIPKPILPIEEPPVIIPPVRKPIRPVIPQYPTSLPTYFPASIDDKFKCINTPVAFCPPPNENTVTQYNAECVPCNGKEGQEFGNPLPTDPDCVPYEQCIETCQPLPGSVCITPPNQNNTAVTISVRLPDQSEPTNTNTGVNTQIPQGPTTSNEGITSFIANGSVTKDNFSQVNFTVAAGIPIVVNDYYIFFPVGNFVGEGTARVVSYAGNSLALEPIAFSQSFPEGTTNNIQVIISTISNNSNTVIQPPQNPSYGSIQVTTQTNNFNNVTLSIENQAYANTSQLLGQLINNTYPSNKSYDVNIDLLASKIYDEKILSLLDTEESSIYHSKLNFFSTSPENKSVGTKFVSNSLYTNIFNETVAEEVSYFLTRENSYAPWNESNIFNLSLEKIGVSLNPNLFKALNSIHFPGSSKVNINNFLETIKKHLVTGTLSNFDYNYYINLAKRQENYYFKNYSNTSSKIKKDFAALVVLNKGSIGADTEGKNEFHQTQLRRQRRLNEEVYAKTFVITLEGETKEFYILNPGAKVNKLEDPLATEYEDFNRFAENSPGDGYYIYFSSVNEGLIPFKYYTMVSASTYAPAQVRHEALTIIGSDPSVYLRATSTSSNHEFVSGYVPSLTAAPLYFKLNLESISSTLTSNEFVETFTASYDLLNDQQLINEHCDSNGFAVIRANIDYDDPLYQYALEGSSISLSQNEINFRHFGTNLMLGQDKILTKNIPHGIIITPTKGSKFNPFNSRSKIITFEDVVSRELGFYPSFDLPDTDEVYPPLDSKYFFEENLSANKVGLVEPQDVYGLTFRYNPSSENFTNVIYDNSVENYTSSSVSPPSSYGISYLIKDIVDKLIQNYNPQTLTWFDIFRRMTLNKFSEFYYDNSNFVLDKLANGLRNGVTIRNILNRPGGTSDEILPDDDMVIIKVEDR